MKNHFKINNPNQSKISRLFVVILIFLGSHFHATSQLSSLAVEIRVPDDAQIDDKAKPHVDEILTACKKHMNNYYDNASLADFKTGKVTSETIKDFRSLFYTNARVFDDLNLYGTSIPIADYVTNIVTYFPDGGLPFSITDMFIKSITSSTQQENHYEIKLGVNKVMSYYIDAKKNKALPYNEVRDGLKSLDYIIILQGDALSEVLIYGIEGKIVAAPKPRKSNLKLFASYGINTNTTFSYFNELSNVDVISPENKAMIDAGIMFSRSFKRGKNSAWYLGLGYGIHKWQISPSATTTYTLPSLSNQPISFTEAYTYDIDLVNSVSFNYLQGLIGIQFPLRPIIGYKMEYWLDLDIMPTYITKKETINANAMIVNNQVVQYKENSDEFCAANIDVANRYQGLSTSLSTISTGVQIKPSIKYHLNDEHTRAFSFGLGYAYYFNSWVGKDAKSIEEQGQTLFISELKPAHIRIELGFIYKL